VTDINLNWQQIDTVLLDMDGTLLDLHFDNYFWMRHLPEAYAKQNGLDFDSAYHLLSEKFETHKGTLNWYCLDFWCEQLQVDIPSLKLEVQHLIKPREGAFEFLCALRQAGKRSVLITNAHRGSLELKMLNTELGKHLDRVLSSHDFGYPKEEQQFWAALQDSEPFDPKRALFIDDTASVLTAARDYGIAWVLGVLWPDSQGVSKEGDHEFPLLDRFSDISPVG